MQYMQYMLDRSEVRMCQVRRSLRGGCFFFDLHMPALIEEVHPNRTNVQTVIDQYLACAAWTIGERAICASSGVCSTTGSRALALVISLPS
jgi:hypothetical protein